MKLAKTLLATALVSASIGANAEWVSGYQGGLANAIDGELLLSVWNPDLERSFTQDLGITTRQFVTGEVGPQDFNLSAEAVAFIGSSDNIRFNIVGYNSVWLDYSNNPTVPDLLFDNFGFFISGLDQSYNPDPNFNSAAFPAETGYFASFQQVLTAAGESAYGTVDDPIWFLEGSTYAGDLGTWGNQMGGLGSDFQIEETSAVHTEALASYVFSMDQDYTLAAARRAELNGATAYWNLDLANNSLSYSAVPVPAAAWLFGSALIGLAGAIRRRKLQA